MSICIAEQIETTYNAHTQGRISMYGTAEALDSGATRVSLNTGEVVVLKSRMTDEGREWSCVRSNDGFGTGLTRLVDYMVYAVSECLEASA